MKRVPRFLAVDDVLSLHAIAIQDQGGDPSIRDRALLESAVAVPGQQFGGDYLHEDVPAMAAAYAFHICKNHPFVDGNKRAAIAAMIAFLSDNGWSFDASAEDAEPVILQLAAGMLDKGTFTDWARRHMHEKPQMELREFFARLNDERFVDAYNRLKIESPGQDLRQLSATCEEAVVHMPVLRLIVSLNNKGVATQDESLRMSTASLIYAFAALYRLAEEMGYEW